MKKNLILIFFFSVIAFMYGKEKVKKHRDQIRLDGFNDIEVSIYTDNVWSQRQTYLVQKSWKNEMQRSKLYFAGN